MVKQKSKAKSKQCNTKSRTKKQTSRNSSSSTVDDAQFRTSLQSQGHTIQEMASDGNCLFRSLSDQLYRDSGAQHALVRNEICNHLQQHRETFECFLLMNDEDEDIVDFDEYVSKMREDGEWGGNVELVVASRVYRRNVKIYSGLYDGGVMLIQYQEDEKDDNKYNDKKGKTKYEYSEYEEHEGIVYFGDLLLSYHENDHYNSVHSIQDKSKTGNQSNDNNGSTNKDSKTNDSTSSSMALSMKSSSRKPRKGADCPCGSGIKYKKCCAAKEKSKARAAKIREKNGEVTEDEKKDELDDGFKVLTI